MKRLLESERLYLSWAMDHYRDDLLTRARSTWEPGEESIDCEALREFDELKAMLEGKWIYVGDET